MKVIILVLLSAAAYAQCPTATPTLVSICTQTDGGYYTEFGKIIPPITPTPMPVGIQFKWDGPSAAMVYGLASRTLVVQAPGVFTLTTMFAANNCTTISTHTAQGCPPGTDMVGIEEYEFDRQEPKYYDVFGNETALMPGRMVIAVLPNSRPKKILVLE